MFTNFLVPLDGSLLAEQALPTAVSLVKRRHGHLELVVVHEPAEFDGLEVAPWHAMTTSMQERYVADKAIQVADTCESAVGHTLLHGDVAAQICEHARARKADMILMSTHGRTGLTRALVGSVADAVVRHACVPVLLLHQPIDAPVTAPLEFRRIVIPIDSSLSATQIFEAASALATPGITDFKLLRIVPPVHAIVDTTMPYAYVAGPIDEAATSALVAQANEALGEIAADLARRSGCTIDPRVIIAEHAGAEILAFARKNAADLIALTTHGRGGSRVLFGSVADSVLRGSEIPLLVLRPAAH